MLKHYITKYRNEKNELIIVSWLQLNLPFYSICFNKKYLKGTEKWQV